MNINSENDSLTASHRPHRVYTQVGGALHRKHYSTVVTASRGYTSKKYGMRQEALARHKPRQSKLQTSLTRKTTLMIKTHGRSHNPCLGGGTVTLTLHTLSLKTTLTL